MKLDLFLRELRRWQPAVNLGGPGTLEQAWTRHILDSAQLAPLGRGPIWFDLGSGAGLPGLVVAILKPDIHMHLIEADSRKCAFLRHVRGLVGTETEIVEARIEAAFSVLPKPDVLLARGLASLDELLALCSQPLGEGAVGLFPKGARHAAELTQARASSMSN